MHCACPHARGLLSEVGFPLFLFMWTLGFKLGSQDLHRKGLYSQSHLSSPRPYFLSLHSFSWQGLRWRGKGVDYEDTGCARAGGGLLHIDCANFTLNKHCATAVREKGTVPCQPTMSSVQSLKLTLLNHGKGRKDKTSSCSSDSISPPATHATVLLKNSKNSNTLLGIDSNCLCIGMASLAITVWILFRWPRLRFHGCSSLANMEGTIL